MKPDEALDNGARHDEGPFVFFVFIVPLAIGGFVGWLVLA